MACRESNIVVRVFFLRLWVRLASTTNADDDCVIYQNSVRAFRNWVGIYLGYILGNGNEFGFRPWNVSSGLLLYYILVRFHGIELDGNGIWNHASVFMNCIA